MPKKKTEELKHSFFETQPSWTGVGPQGPATSTKRLHRWLCETKGKSCEPYRENDFTQDINWRIFRTR